MKNNSCGVSYNLLIIQNQTVKFKNKINVVLDLSNYAAK